MTSRTYGRTCSPESSPAHRTDSVGLWYWIELKRGREMFAPPSYERTASRHPRQ